MKNQFYLIYTLFYRSYKRNYDEINPHCLLSWNMHHFPIIWYPCSFNLPLLAQELVQSKARVTFQEWSSLWLAHKRHDRLQKLFLRLCRCCVLSWDQKDDNKNTQNRTEIICTWVCLYCSYTIMIINNMIRTYYIHIP